MRAKDTNGRKMDAAADKAAFLQQHPIFQHLNADDRNELDRMITTQQYLPGHILYRPGESNNALFLLRTGQVHLYHLSPDGRKLITATLDDGACFGLLPTLGQDAHMHFAETTEPTRLYVLPRSTVEQLLLGRPALTYALLQTLGQRVATLETQLVDTTFKSTAARLATLLLQLAQAQAQNEQPLVIRGLSHESLADRLGVYRETVSTALRELKGIGAIEVGRKHITICSVARLEQQR